MAGNEAFDFAELEPLREQLAEIPALTPFTARDGTTLAFRHYPASSRTHLVLLHGSSGHSAHLHAFAKYLSSRHVASISAPDVRGHGPSPRRRGDIDYIGQLEDDLADLIEKIQANHSPDRVLVGGFSSGGGLALRFAGSRHGHLAQGVLLLAPYLGHGAPMVKQRSLGTGWTRANIPRIVGLMALNAFGVTRFNGLPVLRFNLPEKYRSSYDTLSYSFRLMQGMHPANYRESLRSTSGPMLILVGAGDEAVDAETFGASILPYKSDARVHVVEGKHLGLIMSEAAGEETARWIKGLDVSRV